MNFIILVLPVVLFVCAVNGEDEKQLMVPPFLVGESESTLAEWKELLDKNDDKPDYEVQALVEEWMKKRGDEIKGKYDKFKQNMKLLSDKAALIREEMTKNLSKEAKKADSDLVSIGKDQNLSTKERREKVVAYLSSLAPEIKKELQAAFKLSLKNKKYDVKH